MLFNRANPEREYRIEVKYDSRTPKWWKIYEGPWTPHAAYTYENTTAQLRRVVAVLTDAEVAEVLNENESLRRFDEYLDEYYVIEGNAGDPPNRTAANVKRLR
ncbi:hypothetical protein [Amycolatopsis sp.]|uniref:hypothetical protein n=1 Tax=Amycolatopsis sp. TaxID=37632 RepID=UPI002B95B53E|nr:hypothetical protein [Amycolatopsis sp.]HVV11605.1 hypothetical protein [Amycolatopsis sp.]